MSTSPADFNAQIIDEFHAKRAASATCSRVRACASGSPLSDTPSIMAQAAAFWFATSAGVICERPPHRSRPSRSVGK